MKIHKINPMLPNLSNHPSDQLSEKQLNAAKKKFGLIVDLPFPYISPSATSKPVRKKAEVYLK